MTTSTSPKEKKVSSPLEHKEYSEEEEYAHKMLLDNKVFAGYEDVYQITKHPQTNQLMLLNRNCLGQGSYGEFYVGFTLQDGQLQRIGMKKLPTNKFRPLEEKAERILYKGEIPYIPPIHDPGGETFIFKPFFKGRPLELGKNGEMKGEQKTQFSKLKPYSQLDLIVQLVKQVEKLHDHDIVHGDIKGENVLVDFATNKIHLVDLGLASKTKHDHYKALAVWRREGNPIYFAPETFHKEEFFSVNERKPLPGPQGKVGVNYVKRKTPPQIGKPVDVYMLLNVILPLLGAKTYRKIKTELAQASGKKYEADLAIASAEFSLEGISATMGKSLDSKTNDMLFRFLKSTMNVEPILRPSIHEVSTFYTALRDWVGAADVATKNACMAKLHLIDQKLWHRDLESFDFISNQAVTNTIIKLASEENGENVLLTKNIVSSLTRPGAVSTQLAETINDTKTTSKQLSALLYLVEVGIQPANGGSDQYEGLEKIIAAVKSNQHAIVDLISQGHLEKKESKRHETVEDLSCIKAVSLLFKLDISSDKLVSFIMAQSVPAKLLASVIINLGQDGLLNATTLAQISENPTLAMKLLDSPISQITEFMLSEAKAIEPKKMHAIVAYLAQCEQDEIIPISNALGKDKTAALLTHVKTIKNRFDIKNLLVGTDPRDSVDREVTKALQQLSSILQDNLTVLGKLQPVPSSSSSGTWGFLSQKLESKTTLTTAPLHDDAFARRESKLFNPPGSFEGKQRVSSTLPAALEEDKSAQLLKALSVRNIDIELVTTLIKQGATANEVNADGVNALRLLIELTQRRTAGGQTDGTAERGLIDTLIANTDIGKLNTQDNFEQKTALHIALQVEDLPTVQSLLQRGANPTLQDDKGWDAIGLLGVKIKGKFDKNMPTTLLQRLLEQASKFVPPDSSAKEQKSTTKVAGYTSAEMPGLFSTTSSAAVGSVVVPQSPIISGAPTLTSG